MGNLLKKSKNLFSEFPAVSSNGHIFGLNIEGCGFNSLPNFIKDFTHLNYLDY